MLASLLQLSQMIAGFGLTQANLTKTNLKLSQRTQLNTQTWGFTQNAENVTEVLKNKGFSQGLIE